MSLDGWRPAVVTSESSRNRLPELGPRRTTSRAELGGSASTAAWSALERPSPFSATSPTSTPWMVIVEVSPPPGAPAVSGGVSAVPQLLQNRAPSALRCPQFVQVGI